MTGAANCTESSNNTRFCTLCDEEETVVVQEALGHAWGGWGNDGPATCTEPSTSTRVCSRCNETESKVVQPALGHDMQWVRHGVVGGDHCSRCPYKTCWWC